MKFYTKFASCRQLKRMMLKYDPVKRFDKMSKRIEEDEKNGREQRRDDRYKKYEAWQERKPQLDTEKS